MKAIGRWVRQAERAGMRRARRTLGPLKRAAWKRIGAWGPVKTSLRGWQLRKLLQRPTEVDIETTSHCNARCPMCPREAMQRKMEKMPWDLYTKVINECAELGVPDVVLHFYGDPLCMKDSDFHDYVTYARKCRYIRFSTNGQLFTDSKIRSCVETPVDLIQVDVDGTSREVFEAIRVGCDFGRVKENLRKLIRARDAAGSRLRIGLGAVAQPLNYHQIAGLEAEWGSTVDHMFLGTFENRGGAIQIDRAVRHPGSPCFLPWSQFVVASNGEVALCCMDWDCQYPLGNLHTQSIAEIWRNSPALIRIRDNFLNNREALPEMCKQCSWWGATSPPWW